MEKLSKPAMNIYIDKPIYSKFSDNQMLIKDPIAHNLKSKQIRWSIQDLKIFFEKYFIYDQSEF